MMLGDDIRKHRQRAEQDAALPEHDAAYLPARTVLALFVMAEELHELRRNLGIAIEKLEDGGNL